MYSYTWKGNRVFDWDTTQWKENPYRPEDWGDTTFYSRPQEISGGVGLCQSVSVRGFWTDPYFEDWPGTGYSPAEFRMKALRSVDGRIFRPSALHTGYAVEVVGIPENCITPITYRPADEV